MSPGKAATTQFVNDAVFKGKKVDNAKEKMGGNKKPKIRYSSLTPADAAKLADATANMGPKKDKKKPAEDAAGATDSEAASPDDAAGKKAKKGKKSTAGDAGAADDAVSGKKKKGKKSVAAAEGEKRKSGDAGAPEKEKRKSGAKPMESDMSTSVTDSTMTAAPIMAPGQGAPPSAGRPGWRRVSTRQWIRDFRDHIGRFQTFPYKPVCGMFFWSFGYYPDMVPPDSYERYTARHPITLKKHSLASGVYAEGPMVTDTSTAVSSTTQSNTSAAVSSDAAPLTPEQKEEKAKVKEEKRKSREERRNSKEEKRKSKAEAAAAEGGEPAGKKPKKGKKGADDAGAEPAAEGEGGKKAKGKKGKDAPAAEGAEAGGAEGEAAKPKKGKKK